MLLRVDGIRAAPRHLISVALVGVLLAGCGGAPTPTPTPTPLPDGAIVATIVARGVDFVDSYTPDGSTVTPQADGSVRMEHRRPSGNSAQVDWEIPENSLPEGATILNVDARVCGEGSGDFWESYGPEGADPVEHEVQPPAEDGCWHYLGGHGPETTIEAYVVGNSALVIHRVEWDITYLP